MVIRWRTTPFAPWLGALEDPSQTFWMSNRDLTSMATNAPGAMRSPRPESSNQLFNNADSFGMVFDEAWKRHTAQNPGHALASADKLDLVLASCSDHPFLIENPAMARQVAEFRIRLLGL